MSPTFSLLVDAAWAIVIFINFSQRGSRRHSIVARDWASPKEQFAIEETVLNVKLVMLLMIPVSKAVDSIIAPWKGIPFSVP